MRHRRGMALVDFVIGTLLFSAVILAFGTLTTSKLTLLNAGERMQHGLAATEAKLDSVRRKGISSMPAGQADEAGFRRVERFEPEGIRGEGLVEARALRMTEGAGHQLYEVRVTVIWQEDTGPSRFSLSTVAPLPLGGGQ